MYAVLSAFIIVSTFAFAGDLPSMNHQPSVPCSMEDRPASDVLLSSPGVTEAVEDSSMATDRLPPSHAQLLSAQTMKLSLSPLLTDSLSKLKLMTLLLPSPLLTSTFCAKISWSLR